MRPKIAAMVGKIKGIPKKLTKYSFNKKSLLNNALEMGIAKQQLKVEDSMACFRVKIRTVSS